MRRRGRRRGQATSYVLDNTGPTVTGSPSPAANAAGWNNADVNIAWTATDAGSGVGFGPTPATDSVQANTPQAGVTRTATAADRLGNSRSGSVTVKLDKDNPVVVGSASPAANANGWHRSHVTVSVDCSDALSGIKSCTGGGTKVLSSEGAAQSLPATAVDNADNQASASVGPFNIDKTAPSLSGAVAGGTAGENGWYTSDVTIAWACGDALAGVDGDCSEDSVIAGEGQDLSAATSVSDRAGNTSPATSPKVKIDKTAPNTDASAVYAWNNVDVTVTLEPHDAMSGVAETLYRVDGGAVQTGTSVAIADEGRHTLEYWSVDRAAAGCEVTVSGGLPNGVGTFAYTAKARDAAGNTATVTGSYRVIYRFDGFLQPINDTAHQVGASTSIFKGGSTVPAKFQLKQAGGTVVQANSAPMWLVPAKGTATTAPVDETVYALPADSTNTFRWDGTQYHFNWGTSGAARGYYHRIGVKLDDGQTYTVNIGLR